MLLDLSQYFTEKLGAEFIQRLDALQKEARQAGLRAKDLEQLYLSASSQLDSVGTSPTLTARVLRLLVLELIVRFSSDSTENDFDEFAHDS